MTAFLAALLLFPAQTSRPAESGVALSEPYADGSYGFAIRAPADWTVSRRRDNNGRTTVLLRMAEPVAADDPRAILVEHLVTARSQAVEDRLKQVLAAAAIEFNEYHVDAQSVQPISGRPGAMLSLSYEIAGVKRFRILALAEIAPKNYIVVRHDGLAADRSADERIFNAVLSSLELFANPLSDAELKAALEKGAEWVESIKGEQIRKVLTPERRYVFELDGKPIGCVEVYEREKTLKLHNHEYEGVEIFEQSWMFDIPHVARRTRNTVFLSDDLLLEKWQTNVSTWVQPEGDKPEQFERAYYEGLRDHDVLLSAQTPSLSIPPQQNPPARMPRTYIARVLVRMLPRLVTALDKPRSMAFVAFDHDRVGLVVRVAELKGMARLPGATESRRSAYRIDDREGAVAEPSEIYVDEKGAILLVCTRRSTMRPATLEELKSMFEERVNRTDEALTRMEQLVDQAQDRFQRRK